MKDKNIIAFEAIIIKNPDMDAAYVKVPFDINAIYGKRRLLVHATFDGEAYDGQVVKMQTADYILGIRKDIRAKINKQPGDIVHVTIKERQKPQYASVKAYIASYPEDVRERMETLRALILESSPDITEKMAWSMPTYVLNGNLIHFAGEKHHLGIHPSASVIEAFKDQLTPYKCTKSSFQIPYNEPMPYDLLKQIIAFRIKEQTQQTKG